MKFATKVVHPGFHPDSLTGAVMPAVYQTSTYAQKSPGVHTGYTYSRLQNPTRDTLQMALAALENGKHGFCFASGMAAIDAALKLLRPGDEVIASKDLYGGTFRIMTQVFEPYGISFRFVDLKTPENLEKSLTPSTRMVWMETPSNPLLSITDIEKIAAIARRNGSISVVDSTFASPCLTTPLDLGADIVMHSATKYLGGHSDVIMGALIVNDAQLADQLAFQQKTTGAVPGPQDCYLVFRGLKTLHLRMKQHCDNAGVVARWLVTHPKIARVYYPGLPTHPEHTLAKTQMKHFGGMVSFDLKTDTAEAAFRILERLTIFTLAESLGGVESLCAYPPSMSHASFPPETRAEMGIRESLIRLSTGIEDPDDLIEDLKQAIG